MTTQYNINKYIQGINGFGLQFCDTVYSCTLAANTDTTVGVPGSATTGAIAANQYNKFVAIITASAGDVFVCINETAAVPAGDTFAAVTSGLLPANIPYARYVKSTDAIHFITANVGTNVTVEFYAAPF